MAFAGTQTSETLAQRLIPRRGILENTWVYNLLLTFGGSWFVAILAQISIPLGFTPVPITGQTLGVLLVGSLLGTRLGIMALLLYVVQGTIGFPFFAEGRSGVEVLQGATAGYIFGFVLAAALTGWLAERGWDKRVSTTILSMVIGTLLIYVPGVLWLSTLVGGFGEAIEKGMLPFLAGEVVKIAVAASVLPGGWKLLGSDKQRG